MRDIRFRGKRLDTGEWVKGYYSKGPSGTVYITPYRVGNPIKVDPETVGQWTGLKDCEGYKIYEGDIVRITGNYKPGLYIVFWDEHRVAWWGKNVKRDRRDLQYDDDFYQLLGDCFQMTSREVVGNIYDDPELLDS